MPSSSLRALVAAALMSTMWGCGQRGDRWEVTEYHLGSGAMLERLAIVRHLFGKPSDTIIARWDQVDVHRPDAPVLTCPVEALKHEQR